MQPVLQCHYSRSCRTESVGLSHRQFLETVSELFALPRFNIGCLQPWVASLQTRRQHGKTRSYSGFHVGGKPDSPFNAGGARMFSENTDARTQGGSQEKQIMTGKRRQGGGATQSGGCNKKKKTAEEEFFTFHPSLLDG